ncbi:MAG: DUF551 domain-containing protein [Muricomes sp.]
MRLIDADGIMAEIEKNKLLARESAIKRCVEIIKNATTYIEPKMEELGTWIPVSERLPEVKDGEWAVFVIPSPFGVGEAIITARFLKEQGTNHKDGWTDKRVEKATLWMPLPEQYKPE